MAITVATLACAKCGRPLKRESESGYGPKCERMVNGRTSRSRRRRSTFAVADPRQLDIFNGAAQ